MSVLKLSRYLCVLAVVVAGYAAEPVVKTVPWVASDTSIPHDTYAYRAITLKGTSSLQRPQMRATWDFGDGSPAVTSTVDHAFNVSTEHVYAALTTLCLRPR